MFREMRQRPSNSDLNAASQLRDYYSQKMLQKVDAHSNPSSSIWAIRLAQPAKATWQWMQLFGVPFEPTKK
jgi:hypothetical protein